MCDETNWKEKKTKRTDGCVIQGCKFKNEKYLKNDDLKVDGWMDV